MTTAAILQIIGWGAQAVKAVIEVVQEAIQKAEPPTLDELRKNLLDIIGSRHDDWVAAAKKDADKALLDAAAAEFDATKG